jgi:hypothetical protein
MEKALKTFAAVSFCALLISSYCDCAFAEGETGGATNIDPLAGVSKIVEWFSNLNATFDRLTLLAEQKQFESKVDDVREGLYRLETRSQKFIGDIPDDKPTGETKQKLQVEADDLLHQTDDLQRQLESIGANLRLRDGGRLEELGWSGLRTRGFALHAASAALTSDSEWNAPEIRRELTAGVIQLRIAQKDATQFSNKLANARLPVVSPASSVK